MTATTLPARPLERLEPLGLWRLLLRRLSAAFVLMVLAAALQAGGALAASKTMGAGEAHERAAAGDILLVDIRSPEEWRQTGIGASATAISMHEEGFFKKLEDATGGDKTRPVALICAVGGRSSRMSALLQARGYAHVIDVSEGMIGGRNGKGWILSGLPVKPVGAQ